MPKKIIYHKVSPRVNCPDGIAAAWVIDRFLKKKAEKCTDPKLRQELLSPAIIGCSYEQEDLPELLPGDDVFIVDFSFAREVMVGWEKSGVNLVVIDHHKTALNNLSGFTNAIFDLKECGATLAWKFAFPDERMPDFLRHVRVRDLWEKGVNSPWWGFSLPETAYYHEALSLLGRDFALFDQLSEMNESELKAYLLPIAEKKLNEKVAKVEELVRDRARVGKLYDYEPVAIIRLDAGEDRLHSDVGACMLERLPNVLFAAIFGSGGRCSLRSSAQGNNFDVEEVAVRFGGGGHRNAAGFSPPQPVSGFSLSSSQVKK